jgi:hypothetical protein
MLGYKFIKPGTAYVSENSAHLTNREETDIFMCEGALTGTAGLFPEARRQELLPQKL